MLSSWSDSLLIVKLPRFENSRNVEMTESSFSCTALLLAHQKAYALLALKEEHFSRPLFAARCEPSWHTSTFRELPKRRNEALCQDQPEVRI